MRLEASSAMSHAVPTRGSFVDAPQVAFDWSLAGFSPPSTRTSSCAPGSGNWNAFHMTFFCSTAFEMQSRSASPRCEPQPAFVTTSLIGVN